MPISPVLPAMMCDGLGWFTETDYKRALLVYDEILYLLPSATVEFRDITGEPAHLIHSVRLAPTDLFKIRSFNMDPDTRELLRAAARVDTTDDRFCASVAEIPTSERVYTWRAVNADADLGGAKSPDLNPEDHALAHAMLLNKFLLAADHARAIPITGKAYIHRLLGAKFALAARSVRERFPAQLSGLGQSGSYDAALQQIVSAFVTDDDLRERSYADVLEFKTMNYPLFERFSLLMRQTIDQIQTLPNGPQFRREVENVTNTALWKEKMMVEEHLRSAWHELFGSASKNFKGSQVFRLGAAAAASGVVLGVFPSLAEGALTLATLFAPAAVASTWMLERAFDYFRSHHDAFRNGLYYLMRFNE
jgi:hypothetical protein